MRSACFALACALGLVPALQVGGSSPQAGPKDEGQFKNGAAKMYDGVFSDFVERADLDVARVKWPYDSISLERTACLGRCPVYKATLHRDGTAELHVEVNCSLPKGDYDGVIGYRMFGRFCCALDSVQFETLKPKYEADWTDDATCIVTASLGEKSKSVSDYGTVAPIGLWMVQRVIDDFVDRTEWKARK